MKPNILWICTDQQRFDTLGCYGNPWVQTPHLDALARQGALFEKAYCQSTICSPSRASFLTGRYPRTTGFMKNGQSIPDTEVLVTRLLQEAGYTCGLSGKLHLSACHPSVSKGMEPRIKDGYDVFYWSHHPQEDWPVNEYSHWLRKKGKSYEARLLPECEHVVCGPDAEDHQAAWCAEKAIEFIEANARFEQPWLFSVNIFAPHHPFDPPESHLKRYLERLDEIPLPNYEEGELESKPGVQRRDHNGAYANSKLYPFARMSKRDHKYLRAAYWAMCDLIDEQVGRMLQVLERTGQLDNTIVIFMSDHGELLGDHGIYLKGSHFYEESVHVPLIVSYPGVIQAGKRISALTELLDLAPTLLEAAGLPVSPGMQGNSLLPLLTGAAKSLRQDILCEVDEVRPNGEARASGTMLRTETHKLIVHGPDPEGELYDLREDPQERFNLWNDAASAGVKLQLMERLCRRLADTADPGLLKTAPW
ncbi:sulfatase family protein [Paenibacillus nasutitermitis]|uniref:Sulfatase n=1 Tax=Paenibacillus nasutitermitis TaxID=1652958 RepID=A0A916Z966_9BACL|nr:sulfatase-like hydrolase/transferase [Paenibacillus nasutitermitis]GGD80842.1 sulfatase [Paenibacillus nasutitermitis]